jgi:hypothetical protein
MSTITDAIKTGLRAGVDLATKAVIASTVAALPLLGLPVVNFVFTWLVNWVVGKLTPYLETWFVDRAIDIQVNAEKAAYTKAKTELQAVLKQHVRNPKELQNASDDFDKRLADLIRIRP